jgi:hypothetical protein
MHDFLGEPLGGLDVRGRGGRTERWKAASRQAVDEPRRQRGLRTNDDEIETLPDGERNQTIQVGASARVAGGQRRNAGVPRGAVQVNRRIVALELPGDRVFATAPADDQYLYFSSLDDLNAPSKASRARPSTPEMVAIASLA